MSLSKTRRLLSVAAAGCAVFAATLDARAATCAATPALTAPGATIIYGAGGSSQLNLVAADRHPVRAAKPARLHPLRPAELRARSSTTSPRRTASVQRRPTTGRQTGPTRRARSRVGIPITFAVSGNTPSLCSGVTWPTPGIQQFDGPAQTLDFVVPGGPNGSSQHSISTEAAYYIWSFFASDQNHTVSPWGTPANIFTRSSTSFISTFLALDLTQSLGSNLGVSATTVSGAGGPDGGLFGTQRAPRRLTVSKLAAVADPESGIGLVSGETADQNRASVNILAYQHTGQTCGYLPDSTSASYDKANVRSGQYWLWTPIRFFAAVGDAGQITGRPHRHAHRSLHGGDHDSAAGHRHLQRGGLLPRVHRSPVRDAGVA